MKKIISSFILLLSFACTSWAYDFSSVAPTGQTLYYTINPSTTNVTVTYGSVTPRGSLTIPSSVIYNGQTYTVNGIGDSAFRSCYSLTSVTIPNSVTTIGDDAFYFCSGLTSVIIGNSVTTIGDDAFCFCSRLSVSIPNTVTTIGNSAFSSVKVVCYCGTAAGAPWGAHYAGCFYSDADFVFLDSTMATLIGYTGAGDNITIPHTVTTIGEYAFYFSSGLTSVTIPNTVTTIGNYAFYNCSGLTSVTIPNSVTTIGYSAFSCCSGLTSVTIPNSVTTIGNSAFSLCSGLTSVTIPNSVTTIDNFVFSSCSGLTSVTIPNSVTTIGNYAFSNCHGLTSVTIPNSVITIGNYAFSSTSLNSVILECATPPQIQSNTFPGSATQPIIFHVPCNTAETYRNTDIWNGSYYQYVEDMGCLVLVRVFTNDSTLGTVSGGGTYQTGQTVTLTATPKPNCHFVAWQDGNSQNPRVVTIDSTDTYLDFTAIFAVDSSYAVTAAPNDTSMGTVLGGGSYLARSTAMLCAIPKYDFRFQQWNDGVRSNPRAIQVTSDTSLMAIFLPITSDTVVVHDTIVIHDSVSSRLTYYGLSVFSSNLQRGVVAGNGRFPDSTVVEIAAIPIEGYRFVQWQDGNADNPRTVQLSGTDATFIATFEPSTQSIGTPQSDDDVTITTRNGQITVSNVANRTVRLFDSVGRLLSTSNTPDHTRLFTLPVSGVYLLQVGTAPARRVVVVK